MRRAGASLRVTLTDRLDELERRTPEWGVWLALLREIAPALDPAREDRSEGVGGGPSSTPLLDGRALRVDAGEVQRLLRRLAVAASRDATADTGAATLAGYRPSGAAAVSLLGATVRQEPETVATLAADAGVDAEALATVARVAALPTLEACARRLAPHVPAHWPHGYCPICGAWPILAELRGLDRSRRLRCGRCGSDWGIAWLRCPFCGETDHERLGSFAPEAELETRKVETCASCRGYIKTVTTLQPSPLPDLLLIDLETVELDMVAVDRGYARPEEPGAEAPLDVRVVAR